MHRCLVTTEQLLAETVALEREATRHLQTVLRVGAGDRIVLFDGHGRTRTTVVTDTRRHGLTLSAAEPVAEHPRPRCALTLFVCVSKGNRMDWTVEKAVELGAAAIAPVLSERSVVRLDADDRPAKAGRWTRVAEEAARQCGAAWLPDMLSPMTFADALPLVTRAAPVFVAALAPGARPLREALAAHATPPTHAGWFVGPEGDFTPAELDALLAAGAVPVSLGRHVLRAETACLYGLCALNCAWL